jgi:hypothetical protein
MSLQLIQLARDDKNQRELRRADELSNQPSNRCGAVTLNVNGYVVMPEHVHFLISEPNLPLAKPPPGFHPRPASTPASENRAVWAAGFEWPLVQFYLDGQVATVYSPAHA